MKKLLAILFCLVAVNGWCAYPAVSILDEYAPDIGSTTVINASTTASHVVIPIPTLRSISFLATGSFAVSIGTTTLNTSIAPSYNFGFDVIASMPIGIWAVGTGTYITIYQRGK